MSSFRSEYEHLFYEEGNCEHCWDDGNIVPATWRLADLSGSCYCDRHKRMYEDEFGPWERIDEA